MNKNDIFAALQTLYPEGFEGGNDAVPSPSSYEEYSKWVLDGFTVHSRDEMELALLEFEKSKEARAAIRAERASIAESFSSLPDYIRGPYLNQFNSASKCLNENDYGAALAIIQYADPLNGYTEEQLLKFNEVRGDLMQRIQSLKDAQDS